MSMSGKLAFMCSGQGSQKAGMGLGLADVPEVMDAYEAASDAFGVDVKALVMDESEGAQDALNQTRNAQAAIAATSIGIGRALMARGIMPDCLLGFSLGQIPAIALSGMISDEEAFKLIDVRSKVMDEAASAHPGCMSAFLKATTDDVRAVCDEAAQGHTVVPANFNCPGQIVISGDVEAVTRAEEAWKERGGRASRLATQGAFHSPLMQDACQPFAGYLEGVELKEPSIPVICNTDASPLDAASTKERLVKHLTNPVRFQESVEALARDGVTNFVEIGYGGVLSGLVRRTCKDAERACVQDG